MATSGQKKARVGAIAGGNHTGRSAHLRGQAAVELLSYWSFFFLVFVASIAYLLSVSQEELSRRQYYLAGEQAAQIGGYVDFAFRAGSGFKGTFPIPPDLAGKEYNATFYPSGNLYVEWVSSSGDKQVVVQPIISGAISTTTGGSIANSITIDPKLGSMAVENSNNRIVITQP